MYTHRVQRWVVPKKKDTLDEKKKKHRLNRGKGDAEKLKMDSSTNINKRDEET